jgi:hypothetical protein
MRYLFVLLLAGCSSSGVVPTGQDTYMVSRRSTASSGGEITVKLFREANAFCEKDGKEVFEIGSRSRDAGFARTGNAELRFRCVEKK